MSKLKHDLCHCVKSKVTESTAPPQHPHKQDTNFLRHPVYLSKTYCNTLKSEQTLLLIFDRGFPKVKALVAQKSFYGISYLRKMHLKRVIPNMHAFS